MPMHRALARKLARDIWARKGSLLALALIAALGVGVFAGMLGVNRDMRSSRDRYYAEYRMADFTVDAKRIPAFAVEAAARVPNVRAAEGRVQMGVLIDLPGRREPLPGTALSLPEQRRPVLNDIFLRSGAWFGGRDECIVNHAFAEANGLKPGDRVKVLLLDKQHDLLIVGTAMSPEFVYLLPPAGGFVPDPQSYGVLYLPERFLQESADLQGAYNQVVGLAHDNSKEALRAALPLVEARLEPYGVVQSTPIHEQPSAWFLADELKQQEATAKILPVIFLAVAALVLNVVMARLVVQQRTVVGTLKALGYSSAAVSRHFLAYGVVVGVLGGACGIALGTWLEGAMLLMYRDYFELPDIRAGRHLDLLLWGLGISVGFAVAGTLKGVRNAARLAPADAMRSPPPEKGRRVLPERFPRLWARLPFAWKMALRAIFRNPFRSSVGVLAALVSTALIVYVLSMVDGMKFMTRHEFVDVAHQDVTVTLRDPRGTEALAEFAALPGARESEPQLHVACDLSYGPARRRVGVQGLAKGSLLYTPLDRGGQPVTVPDAGLVLGQRLAEVLGVKAGDILELRPLIGRRERVRAAVAEIVDTYIGLGAYAEIGYLSRLIGEERSANVFVARTFTREPSAAFVDELRERPGVVGVTRRSRSLQRIQETFDQSLGVMVGILVVFAGSIAFGSVLNAALVALSERQRDVGTLRVLGYAPWQVTGIFAKESLALNALGVALGIVAGIGLAHVVSSAYNTDLYRLAVIVGPMRLVTAALLMTGFVVLAQAILHLEIRRLNWLDVLKVKE